MSTENRSSLAQATYRQNYLFQKEAAIIRLLSPFPMSIDVSLQPASEVRIICQKVSVLQPLDITLDHEVSYTEHDSTSLIQGLLYQWKSRSLPSRNTES